MNKEQERYYDDLREWIKNGSNYSNPNCDLDTTNLIKNLSETNPSFYFRIFPFGHLYLTYLPTMDFIKIKDFSKVNQLYLDDFSKDCEKNKDNKYYWGFNDLFVEKVAWIPLPN